MNGKRKRGDIGRTEERKRKKGKRRRTPKAQRRTSNAERATPKCPKPKAAENDE